MAPPSEALWVLRCDNVKCVQMCTTAVKQPWLWKNWRLYCMQGKWTLSLYVFTWFYFTKKCYVARSWMIFSGVIWSGIFFEPRKTQIIRSMSGCFVFDTYADISFKFSCLFDSQRLWQSVLRTSDIWKKIFLTPNYVIPASIKIKNSAITDFWHNLYCMG